LVTQMVKKIWIFALVTKWSKKFTRKAINRTRKFGIYSIFVCLCKRKTSSN
jgi:hypothetical protein